MGGNGASGGRAEPAAVGDGGKGGARVSRGPGHATLDFTNQTTAQAGKAMPLPPGASVPDAWVPLGSRRSEPEVDPQRAAGAGAAGAEGRGGAAWQLQLLPRHRAAVQRFFGGGDAK